MAQVADRKQALLDEFNTVIGPQKAAIAQRLPQLWAVYAPPPDLAALASALQPPAAVNGGAGAGALVKGGGAPAATGAKRMGEDGQAAAEGSKRLKTAPSGVDDLDRRLEALFKEVGNLIHKKVWQKKEAAIFREPVDVVKYKIPDYFTIIKHPMDLGTVRAKLARHEYKTPMDACEDVRLVWRNCATYNQPGTPARRSGDMLADVWEKAWAESRIEERWFELQMARDSSGSVPLKVNHLSSQVRSAVAQHPGGGVPPSGAGGPMSELDKRRLSIQLAELQGEQLAALLALIQGDLPPTAPDEELELDLDALPPATLRRMQAFVTELAARRSGYQSGPLQAGGGGAAGTAPAGLGHSYGHGLHAGQPGHAHAPHKAVPTPGGGFAAPLGAGHVPMPASQPRAPSAGPMDEDGPDATMAGSSGGNSPGDTVDSQEEVKGSTADDPHAKDAVYVWPNNKAGVDESATAPHATSSILRDKGSGRKGDVHVDAAAWDVAALAPGGEEGEEGAADDAEDQMWVDFKSKEEQKRLHAEEQRKLKEQQEEELRKKKASEEEEARRAASEAAERERVLAAAEEAAAQEQARQRMEQCGKEVDEIKAQQGTANLVQRDDMSSLIVQAAPAEGALAAVGLAYKDDDDDVDFDDE